MQDFLIPFFSGSIISVVAACIVAFWLRKAPAVESAVSSLPEVIEAKFNIDIPDRPQELYHKIVHAGIAYVNRFASDKRFWREVLRAIMAGDADKAIILQREVASLSWDRGIAAVEAMLSPELKQIVNDVKESLGVKVITANLATAGVSDIPMMSVPPAAPGQPRVFVPIAEPKEAEREVRAAIRVVAPAHKPVEGPVTSADIEQMILESIERQKKLAAKK